MLLKQGMNRFGNRSRWIAVLSLLAAAGVWMVARPGTSHSVAPAISLAKNQISDGAHIVTPAEQARIAVNYGNLPLSFEPNQGQTDPQVKFLSRNNHYNLFLTANEAVFTLPIASREKEQSSRRAVRNLRTSPQAVLRMTMLGANASPRVEADTQIAGHSNYLIGRDANKWVRDVNQFARVNYHGIYPGIDLTFYGQQRQLEFDFLVAPGAQPKSIALGIEGAKNLRTDASGDLVLSSAAGDLRLHKPVAYQQQGDTRQPVDARFVIKGTEVAFALGDYDTTRELVIDPSFLYSTYLGAGAEDDGYAIAVDNTGAAYVTGQTSSPGFPTPNGNHLPAPNNALQGTSDAFVTKFSADGATLVYSTFLGGTGVDSGNAIALDGANQAYVVGTTNSNDFPGVGATAAQPSSGGGNDAFVAVLNATGNGLVYASYIGGGSDEIGYAVAVDSTGIYVAGSTASNDFPVASALQGSFQGGTGNTPTDGFVEKIDFPATGALVFASYLGGSGNDLATGIAVDANHVMYVTGDTQSTNFPFQGIAGWANANQCGTDGNCNSSGGSPKDDSFVSAISLSGALATFVYSHYLGGSAFDVGNQIAVDSTGAYVVGITSSSDFPTTASAFQKSLGAGSGVSNAYIAKVNPTGTALVFSTYLGGGGTDNALGVAIDGSQNVYITGSTTSNNFPTQSPFQGSLGGNSDAFVTELASSGASLVFSTYLGGHGEEDHFLAGIAVDGSKNIYVTGDTNSSDFPVTGNAFKQKYTNSCSSPCRDAFVVKYSPLPPGFTVSVGAINPSSISRGSSGTATVTVNSTTGAGTVNLACNIVSSAAKPPTCSVTQPSGALSAGGSITGGVTINTSSSSTSIVTTAFWLPLPGLALLGIGLVPDPRRRKKLLLGTMTCLALTGILLMAGCGSGNGGGGGGGGGGTTTGSYTVTVTGTITNLGSANGSANFSVQ